jgi:hypothetical protein
LTKADGYVLVARRSTAEDPADTIVAANSSFVLAANRTHRRDPLNGFRKYPGGWNISEVHYWAVSLFETLHLCCLIHLLLAQYNTNRPDSFLFSLSDLLQFHYSPLPCFGLCCFFWLCSAFAAIIAVARITVTNTLEQHMPYQ